MVDNIIRERQEDIDSHPMSEEWFRDFSESSCRFQGIDQGTREFRECRERQIEKVLDSSVKAAATRPMAIAMSAKKMIR